MAIGGIDDIAPGDFASLDAADRARAARFLAARARIQFVAARLLVRATLGTLLGVAPGALRFVAGRTGKPAASIDGVACAVSFSLSHTDGMVGLAYGAGAGRAIGFDLEAVDRPGDLGFVERYLHPEERAALAPPGDAARRRETLRLWTLREAYVKATGEGLAADMAAFRVVTDPPAVHAPGAAGMAWHCDRRDVGDAIAAVVVAHPAQRRPAISWAQLSWARLCGAIARPPSGEGLPSY